MTPPAVIDQTIDEVIRLHDDFLDICMKECMLHNPQLLKILTKLMSTVRAARGRLCGLSVSHSENLLSSLSVSHRKSALYGFFVWARWVLNCKKRRGLARAVHHLLEPHGPLH